MNSPRGNACVKYPRSYLGYDMLRGIRRSEGNTGFSRCPDKFLLGSELSGLIDALNGMHDAHLTNGGNSNVTFWRRRPSSLRNANLISKKLRI